MKEKRIIVISGPSGVGKDTLISRALEEVGSIYFAVSATTRTPRGGEVNGVDYHFLKEEEFWTKVEEEELLEHKEVYGKRYGTLKSEVERGWAEGMDVLLELDVKGALAVKEKYSKALLVFVAPPSIEGLRERIKYRDLDDEEEMERRLEIAPWEIEVGKSRFDRMIVNDDLEKATGELIDILRVEGGV